jgi:bacteriocin-like protein
MADPKVPSEPKIEELTANELDAVTGGAVDAFIYFDESKSTLGKAINGIGAAVAVVASTVGKVLK